MQFTVLETEKFNQLFADIAEIKAGLERKREQELANEWIPSEAARISLGVCRKTWQDYRDKKVIPFSQFGRKIFVKRADLDNFMKSHYIK